MTSSDDQVFALVGRELRLVDRDTLIATHNEVADRLRARGLVGVTLDHAIARSLPFALATRLDGVSYH